MILLTKISGEEFALNCDLIETIHERPDTTIHLTDGKIYLVRESMDEVIKRATAYHKEVFSGILNNHYGL